MKKYFLFSILACLFASASVMAIEKNSLIDPEMIFGGVKQANSAKPMKDVTITIIQQNKSWEKIIQTNQKGEFGIDNLPPGTYKLVFQKDGYKKVVKDKISVKADSGIELHVEMEETMYELSPSPFLFFKF